MLEVGSNPRSDVAVGSSGAGGVLDLAARRLQWLDARQQVLAANVANSDTPGYVSRDVSPFADQLSQITMQAARTDPAHFSIDSGSGIAGVQTVAHERAPDGNAISLQQQLTEIAGNDSDQRMTTSLYSKVMQMYSTVLGR
ncbi:flagellar basal-body rod protein FlgB [Endobacter medicaginis]|uniref:Flagellar basal body rod protein FlgB n=1 Tax=Endobacter medicaginis TaxID=1181271 RepID=A0A839UX87_9PROT|nr:flagellar basal body protein [Endobacter medicaginis]MBB3172690.1 flagellar basal-body rod protein FlgB [Endobacter medicaginis]MCX5475696.1 flagellar basal body protein [Endobacter medicaginis]NVN29550.1 flagellar biosynthesis protein FlgB [Endobacter medicaginis]